MIAKPRVYFAFSFLVAGVLLAPLIRTGTGPINWEAMVQAYQDPIFVDGFEDGTTNAWSATVNGTKVTLILPQGSPVARDILQSMDSFGRAWVLTAILVEHGYSGHGFNAGPNTLVENCTVRIEESGIIVISFSMPPDS